jgi:hypothetical protein
MIVNIYIVCEQCAICTGLKGPCQLSSSWVMCNIIDSPMFIFYRTYSYQQSSHFASYTILRVLGHFHRAG